MIRPVELASDLPYGAWSCRGSDVWRAFRAAETGDAEALRRLLARDPNLCHAEYWYTPPLYFAAREGRLEAARVLLAAGADPEAEMLNGDDLVTVARDRGHEDVARLLEEARSRHRASPPEPPDAPTIAALHAAASAGDRAEVERLLAAGADPNGEVDSSGSATFAARTPEIRALLIEHGGTLDAYDLIWLGEEDEAVRRVTEDPSAADAGCGGVLAAACARGRRDLLERLLEAGARVPPVLTACRSYLLRDPAMLRLLLESGMDPGLPNWQRATPLHDLCGRDSRGRPLPHRAECAEILLDAGASLVARDDDYRSTPLAWAARCDLPDMVELLLARGAPTSLPDDEPWATPLAWAIRRGHGRVAALLRRAGASA